MFPSSPPRASFYRQALVALVLLILSGICLFRPSPDAPAHAQASAQGYRNFESPQVHPLAMTPDGTRLLALNTPNNKLSVFHLTSNVLTLIEEIPVGLEPVSVAVRNDREAWVTNWLSDSVSIVDLANGNVKQTLDVGDEPTDVVFAGQQKELAFVCVSGLGQVKVYDASQPASPPQVIDTRAKQPRALTRTPDGASVFVSIFESGNRTTIISANQVASGGGLPAPVPAMSSTLPAAPNTGLILKWNGSQWADGNGNTKWSAFVPYTLADVDVLVIDARSATPAISQLVRGVGTQIGNATFDASANRLYVANTEAHNEVRFEPNLRGRFLSTRLSIVNLAQGATAVQALDLNAHVNFSSPAGSDAERALSLALPADLKRASDGTLYVAATGSAKVGVLDQSGNVQARIGVGQGPTGLVLDEGRARLYVLNRFEETLSLVDTGTRTELRRVPLGFNPEPASVRDGRRFLYDATLSAHGDLACASCHSNGHRDGLAWDLGDPQGSMQQVVNPVPTLGPFRFGPSNFHPMKGPMTTQSLRGLTGTEPLHWRGDRAALSSFNPAFMSLLGGPRQLAPDEMTAFEDFVRTLTYPPNPNQNPDRTLPNPTSGPNAVRGAQLFNTARLDGSLFTCNQCHTASPGAGTNRGIIPGLLLQEPQDFKVPQLRGLYQKTGMRNAPGEQLSGFGFAHDGSFDSLLSFLRAPVFVFNSDADRLDVAQFVLSFDTGIAPAVGMQQTVTAENKSSQAAMDRINLLMSQADRQNCDLVVKGMSGGVPRGFVYAGGGMFQTDRASEAQLSAQALVQSVSAGQELTFTGVPPGTGHRNGIDNDGDGTLDGDAPRASAIDDAQFFVSQHYLDFLNREPDAGGLGYWTNEIAKCGSDPACTHERRVGVSAAFFIELEFQETGYYVYRMYKAALGHAPDYQHFTADRPLIVPGTALEQSKQAFAEAFVQRPDFTAPNAYPPNMSAADFVQKLYGTAGLASDIAGQAAQIEAMQQGKTRAQVLRDVIETNEFKDREYNPAFVLMQYFGYLKRDPEQAGYDFWLNVLNNKVPGNYRSMVCAFITSAEYQKRFSLVVTHSNQECR
jgi:YVTN family beta-propeller protein